MKVNIKIDASGLNMAMKKLREAIDENVAEEVGEVVVSGMKRLIASGQSPVKGIGRFQRYLNPDKYPAGKKPNTPVNLLLSGVFIKSLTFDAVSTKTTARTEVYYEGEESLKELGHRYRQNGQPSRPSLPTIKGERFAATIEKEYLKVYQAAIDKVTD